MERFRGARDGAPGAARSLDRRRLIRLGPAGAAAAVLAACSPTSPGGRPGEADSSSGTDPSDGTTPPKPSDTDPSGAETPSAGPPGGAGPTRDDIAARFANTPPGEFSLQPPGTRLGLPAAAGACALTLDACGGPAGSAVDHALLKTLRRHDVPVSVFVNRRWAQANPGVMEELVADPLFDVQNHGTEHKPLSVRGASAYGISGTSSPAEVFDEVMGCQEHLRDEFGVECRFFRSGTAHLDAASAAICADLGLVPVNFTVNLDDGATLPPDAVAARLSQASSGDILLGHMNAPHSGTGPGVGRALPALLGEGLDFAALSEILPERIG